MNVTEYWKPKELRAFIQNASAYHARSKMPAFADLTQKNLDQLLVYLDAMKRSKAKVP
jgi:cytochrome c1